ncbi:MAG: SRPBCC family protein [Steroidobacteraceae bacterium]|nr:SRPBCC family protein [Steroidobacteraceae bacterium]
MNPALVRLAAGAAVIAAAGYILNPARAPMRDMSASERMDVTASRLREGTGETRRGLSARAKRLAERVKTAWRGEIDADKALLRKVRSAVRSAVARVPGVGVAVRDGRVLLHGDVAREEHERIVRAVSATPGVREVSDQLIERDTAEIPERQMKPPTQGDTWRQNLNLRQEQWTPTARLLMGVLGAALIGSAARRRTALGALAGLGGSALLFRSAANKPLTRMGPGRGVIDVQKELVINAPIERVFGLFAAQENFPMFMRNIREVRRDGNGRTHWAIEGPAGSTIEWDSTTTLYRPNEILAWRSLPGSTIEHSGVIRFERLGDNRTGVDVRVSYSPPAGVIGDAMAKLYRKDLRSELSDDLARLKRIAECWDSWRTSIESGMAERGSLRDTSGATPAAHA